MQYGMTGVSLMATYCKSSHGSFLHNDATCKQETCNVGKQLFLLYPCALLVTLTPLTRAQRLHNASNLLPVCNNSSYTARPVNIHPSSNKQLFFISLQGYRIKIKGAVRFPMHVCFCSRMCTTCICINI